MKLDRDRKTTGRIFERAAMGGQPGLHARVGFALQQGLQPGRSR
jgi:hypothetical protein